MEPRDLTPGEWAALALLCENDTHGWTLVRALAPDGEIGAVWSVRRALVYRAIDTLGARGLVAEVGDAKGARGASRTVLSATTAGRDAVARWLDEPVEHVRDARSLLLLKLLFLRRAGRDATDLLARQAAVVAAAARALEERLTPAEGTDAMLLAFRLESTRAVGRFVAAVSEAGRAASPSP